jgi:hypothetical protein
VNSAVKPKKLPLPKQSTIRNIHDTLTRSHPILEGDYQNSTSSKIANQHIQNPSASTEPPYQATITITLRHPSKNHLGANHCTHHGCIITIEVSSHRSPSSTSNVTTQVSTSKPVPVGSQQTQHVPKSTPATNKAELNKLQTLGSSF